MKYEGIVNSQFEAIQSCFRTLLESYIRNFQRRIESRNVPFEKKKNTSNCYFVCVYVRFVYYLPSVNLLDLKKAQIMSVFLYACMYFRYTNPHRWTISAMICVSSQPTRQPCSFGFYIRKKKRKRKYVKNRELGPSGRKRWLPIQVALISITGSTILTETFPPLFYSVAPSKCWNGTFILGPGRILDPSCIFPIPYTAWNIDTQRS